MFICLPLTALLFGRTAAGMGASAAQAGAVNDGAPPGAPWNG
jgi:hypothetical protein